MTTKKGEITQNRISQLASDITERLRESIKDIQSVNDDIHVLSINAKILAAKAGAGGRGFAVVADAVRAMVSRTQRITDALRVSIDSTVRELMEINDFLGTKVRAERLSQVAENMIDIVDRNLYERSCDVRWWSTEASLVEALENPGPVTAARCAERLGIILDSYTVYLDIVVCDLAGTVVANGRPDRFASVGRAMAGTKWFTEAMRAANGDEYGFEGVHRGPLAGGKPALIYSCGIRRGGVATGALVGALGVVFNWAGLGDVVASRANEMLAPETGRPLRALLANEDGKIIAESGTSSASSASSATEALETAIFDSVRQATRGFLLPDNRASRGKIVGFAASKGFETYRSGWYALVQEEILED